ncbi:MAG: TIGR00153 family protein [Gammaproteobacteria bacterium]
MTIATPIFDMFARSPLLPLQEHMRQVQKAVDMLLPFFNYVVAGDWTEAERLQHDIARLEKEADQLKKDLRLHLPNGLFMPVARTDVLEILTSQDRLANKAKDIAGLVIGRQLRFPTQVVDKYLLFLERSIGAAQQATKAINELDELLETGFRGNEVKLVEGMIHELDAIEHDTDEMQVEIRKIIFSLESQLSPIDVIFLYKTVEWTGDLADRAQVVGGQLHMLLAR